MVESGSHDNQEEWLEEYLILNLYKIRDKKTENSDDESDYDEKCNEKEDKNDLFDDSVYSYINKPQKRY